MALDTLALILALMESIHIASPSQAADWLIHNGKPWTRGSQSAANQAYKLLCQIPELEKHRGFFRVKGCQSEFNQHARILTDHLIQLLKVYPDTIIKRECWVEPLHLRSDAICLIKKDEMVLCFILEVLLTEKQDGSYFQSKVNTWTQWPGGLDFLSQLFATVKIVNFGIVGVREGQNIIDLLPPFPPGSR